MSQYPISTDSPASTKRGPSPEVGPCHFSNLSALSDNALLSQPTAVNINAGVFLDPKHWRFGADEPNYLDVDDLISQCWNDPQTQRMLHLMSEQERKEKWAEMESSMRRMDMKVYGVSVFFFAVDDTSSTLTTTSVPPCQR